MVERGHAREADFERDRDVALHLFGAPALGLGHDLHHRRDRVRIRLDVELAVRVQAPDDDEGRRADDDEGEANRQCDEALDHVAVRRSLVDGGRPATTDPARAQPCGAERQADAASRRDRAVTEGEDGSSRSAPWGALSAAGGVNEESARVGRVRDAARREESDEHAEQHGEDGHGDDRRQLRVLTGSLGRRSIRIRSHAVPRARERQAYTPAQVR